jgi:hypothetical protein
MIEEYLQWLNEDPKHLISRFRGNRNFVLGEHEKYFKRDIKEYLK